MLFNTAKSKDFEPQFQVDGTNLELVEQTKLLGVNITSDVKWQAHVDDICKRAYSRLWMVKRLAELGASEDTLIDTYDKQVRTILEYCVPVWHSRLTINQADQLERVQSVSMKIILGLNYTSSRNARQKLNFETLFKRRQDICLKFGKKALEHKNHSNWFQPNPNINTNRRTKQNKLKETFCKTDRYSKSTIPYLTRIINKSERNM